MKNLVFLSVLLLVMSFFAFGPPSHLIYDSIDWIQSCSTPVEMDQAELKQAENLIADCEEYNK